MTVPIPVSEQKRAVVIGGSAGSVEALATILRALPQGYGLPVIVVVHLPPEGNSILAEVMRPYCVLPVVEVEDKIALTPGTVFIAPPDYHLLVEANGHLSLSTEAPVLFSRPSIDVLFESAADVYGAGLTAVVMTGANEDGAQGLKIIMQAGGTGLVQNPETAYSPTMPMAAIDAAPAAQVLSLQEIGLFLAGAV